MLKKVFSLITSSVITLSLATPAVASIDIDISGNGAGSEQSVQIEVSCETVATQQNETEISLNVSQIANTGGNEVSDATGGDVSVTTGDVTNNAQVTVAAGANILQMPPCEHDEDIDITVSDNGTRSDISFDVWHMIRNMRHSHSELIAEFFGEQVGDTGHNGAEDNTGADNIEVETGEVENNLDVSIISPTSVIE